MRREKQKTVHHFSFVHLPPAAVSTAILFLLIAGGLFMSRLFIPDVFGPKFRQGAVSSVELYKLSDDLHQGLFRASPRNGDTTPSLEAAFQAVSIYGLSEQTLSDKDAQSLKNWVLSQESNWINSASGLHYAAVVLKFVGGLNSGIRERINQAVLALHERASGFRETVEHAASIDATYHALSAFEATGQLEAFKASEEAKSVAQFVKSVRDKHGGYRQGGSGNSTLPAAYAALRIGRLLALSGNDSAALTANLENFVLRCQGEDGGFQRLPRALPSNRTRDPPPLLGASEAQTTLQGLWLIAQLPRSAALEAARRRALAYLRSCLGFQGVHADFHAATPDLEAARLFLEYLHESKVSLGLPPALEGLLLAAAAVFAALGLLSLYQGQFSPQLVASSQHQLLFTAGLLATLAGLLYLGSGVGALLVALALATYLGLRSYEYLEKDTPQQPVGLTFGVALSVIVLLLFFVLPVRSATAFGSLGAHLAYHLLAAVSVGASAGGVAYYLGSRKFALFHGGAFVSWAASVALFSAFVYARGQGSAQVAWRLLNVQGLFPLVFWALPLVSFAFSLTLAALGVYLAAWYRGQAKSPIVPLAVPAAPAGQAAPAQQ